MENTRIEYGITLVFLLIFSMLPKCDNLDLNKPMANIIDSLTQILQVFKN